MTTHRHGWRLLSSSRLYARLYSRPQTRRSTVELGYRHFDEFVDVVAQLPVW